ncbi:bifunctional 2-polyprenyl-6-hydroxyphenol methylase/3-demethylubiquinol 3-O-methyltransferase UbiG [Thioalkalivibrio sp. ALMg9]|uniref:class I SAM-dependent methyltransferase n=1 Tax=Thioalkalivibrio sp. ALMg9 TaxID=1266912 RepID=UPI0009D91942|nr:class I SAM-dependent methyltransferase [Thioalkalivibrio sp. ALMg9]
MKPLVHAWPSEGIEHVERCPVCGSSGREQLYSGLTDRVFDCAPGRWDLYQCKGCQSAYLDPRPTPRTIHLAYETYYTHQPPVARSTERMSGAKRLVHALANGYRNHRYHSDLEPANGLGPYVFRLLPRYRKRLDRKMRSLPPPKPGGHLLDVGFGSGAFLLDAQRAGWQVSGADPDPVSVMNGRGLGLDVRQGGIEAFEDFAETFDVISLAHVIEHVHDPVGTLKMAYGLLKPGGLLYVETPNIHAYGHVHFKEHWRGLEIPRHLVIFNWESMTKTLKKVGFTEIQNLSIPSPYVNLAGKSRAIREGRDPYRFARKTLGDRFNGVRVSLPFLADGRKTEFVALYARKDHSS